MLVHSDRDCAEREICNEQTNMIFRQQSHHNRLDVCPSLAEQVRLLSDFAESFFIVQHWQHVLLLVLGGTGEQDSSSMHELTQAYVISSSQAALNRYESDRIGMNTVAREHHRKYDLTPNSYMGGWVAARHSTCASLLRRGPAYHQHI